MPDIYNAPDAQLHRDASTTPAKTRWLLLLFAFLLAYLGVSVFAPWVNSVIIHHWVPPSSALYWPARLISDLVQSSAYLFAAGYLVAKASRAWRYWICGFMCLFFMANTFRIIGWQHILFEVCRYHWYDLLSVAKTPIALIGGCIIGSKLHR